MVGSKREIIREKTQQNRKRQALGIVNVHHVYSIATYAFPVAANQVLLGAHVVSVFGLCGSLNYDDKEGWQIRPGTQESCSKLVVVATRSTARLIAAVHEKKVGGCNKVA